MQDDAEAPARYSVDQERLEHLRSACGSGPVLILTHDNPDPDALASGKALAFLLKQAWGIQARLVYSGVVARAENRALLSELAPEWEYVNLLVNLSSYSAVALVDTQPGAGNNILPLDFVPQIVFDHHHPLREGLSLVRFVDVRPDLGSTVSLIYQYLESAAITPDGDLATAMFYGLQTDTLGLARNATPLDIIIYTKLLGWLDRQKLVKIAQAGLSRVYFRAFSKGLNATRIFGKSIVADLGELHRPDLPAEMADLLIRLDGIQAALCTGYHNATLYLSLRTAIGKDAGSMVQEIILPPGKAGGHGTIAGGQIPLDGKNAKSVAMELERRFLNLMGESAVEGEPLLGDQAMAIEDNRLGSQTIRQSGE